MNARASLNGITLAAPASAVLAGAIGLTLTHAVPRPLAQRKKPAPDVLPLGADRARDLMLAHGKPVTRRDFREALGQTAKQCDALMNGIRFLIDHGLAEITAGRGTSSAPYIWALTEAGRSWQPKRLRPITNADILAAVGRINARPRSAEASLWWTGLRSEYPASPSTVCDELLANGRKRASLAFFRDRLAALAETGELQAVAVPRRGGTTDFYWLPESATRR